MLRIIAGTFRSRLLKVPFNPETQPTKDRVKEAIFSSLGQQIVDKVGLDLFAGSGAFAFEALSRGARFMVLNDRLNEAWSVIRDNASTLNVLEQTKIYQLAYSRLIDQLAEEKQSFDFIFLDPPYAKGLAEDAYKRIEESHLLKENGIVIVEDSQKNTWLHAYPCTRLKDYIYGQTHISILWK
jgi:16S rRNA (guanine(966)-N(2))-methyltransferase RsmD